MGLHWGVDSWNTADHMIRRRSVYDRVTEWAGREPEFWARYIGTRSGARGSPPLTLTEVSFLGARGCRILLIYNRAGGSAVSGDIDDGRHHARQAAAYAKGLGVTWGVRLYLNVEPQYRISQEFLQGWWQVIFDSPYAGMGGMYGNPTMRNITTSYSAAQTALPAQRPGSAGWLAATRYHWSSHPKIERGQRGTPPPAGPITIPFRPMPLPGAGASTPSVVWQYGFNVFWRTGAVHGLIDMNLANQQGFADMWVV